MLTWNYTGGTMDDDQIVWMDGAFILYKDAKIPILTHTLHYGSGVFEGERAYNGRIFKMQEHHERLHNSAAILDFKIPYSVNELNIAAEELIERNNLTNAYIRPIAWKGSEALSVGSAKNSIHVAIAAWRWDSYYSDADKGIKLSWSKWVRPTPTSSPVHAKATGQYIINTLSRDKAELEGFNDALLLDYRGYVAECTGANIFIVKNGVLYTPIADCFLNGITRRTVMELAGTLGIELIEKYILPQELLDADEVFITGTAVEVQPICQIDHKTFAIGPVTLKLKNAFDLLAKGVH